MRRAARWCALVGLALTLVGIAASPASAHAVLEGTDPGAGSTVARSPRAITLSFGESVEASLGAIRLYDSQEHRIDVGPPEHPNGRGSEVSASVPHLDDDSYVVTWRVVSADSHPVQGAFTFSVGTGAPSLKAQTLAARLLTENGGEATVGVTYALARLGVFVGLVLLIGAVGFLLLVWPDGRASRRARALVWTGWVVATAATASGFVLQGVYAAALPLSDAFRPSIWTDLWDTRYGHVAVLRLLVLLLALPVLTLLLPRRTRRGTGAEATGPPLAPLPGWWSGAAVLLGLALVVTPGLSGHAGTGIQVPLALLADTVHMAAASLWVGALPVLAWALLPRADVATLRSTIPRYSQLALGCVVALIVSGAYQSWRQVGSLHALTSTDFGRILLVKLGVFAALVIVAAWSRDVVNQKFRYADDDEESMEVALVGASVGGGVGSGVPGAPDPAFAGDDGEHYFDRAPLTDEQAARRLRRSVWLEVGIAVVVLAVTALLVNAAPAREESSGPWIGYIKTPTLWFDTNVVPASVGPNDVHVTAITPGGAPKDTLEMSGTATDLDRDLGPIDIPLRRLAPGHYVSAGFRFPFAGRWRVEFTALVDETTSVTGSADITIR